MKRFVFFLAVVSAGVFLVTAAGCDEGVSSGSESERPPMADEFRDQAAKFYPSQEKCPVCGGQPIKKEAYVDHQMKRIYFDKQECADKFEQDPHKYIQQWMQAIQKQDEERVEEEMQREGEASSGSAE